MRQIIPFKKELLLSTKINDVTSISLEHTLSLKEDNIIKGSFIISGDYKMTASSINREKFKFDLPVEIELDEEYNYEKAQVDIDNFYYEIVNDDTIKVNIDVYIDTEKKETKETTPEKTVIIEEENSNETTDNNREERLDINIDSDIDINVNSIENSNINKEEEKIEEGVVYKETPQVELNDTEEKPDDNKINLFNTDSFSNDTYATYYVYIIKEDDTIDKVLEKFQTTKEILMNYNDIDNLKKGNKLIIPVKNE